MSEDNRQRPHIIRVLPAVNERVRAYAARQGVAPNVAAEALINGTGAEIAALDKRLVALRADLESAREATRRADAEVERLTRELALERDAAAHAARLAVMREEERDAARSELAEVRAALATKGATDRLAERVETIAADVDRRACACALPNDLAPRLAAIAARRDVEPHVMLANVIKNGISKIQASDEYQDRQKAARKARS